MKKFFSLMMVAVVALLASVSASAFTITFNLDHAGSAFVIADGTTYELHEGANELTFDFQYSYCNVEVKANEGWKLVSVDSADPNSYGNISIWGGSASQYFYMNDTGRTYNITTMDLSAVRTATLTVNIDGDEAAVETVQLQRDGSKVALNPGENIIKFNPEEESEMIFTHTTYDPFYKITCNGEPVPSDQWSSFRYTVTVKDGDVIFIEPNYPDIDVAVTINCPIEGAITSVLAGTDTQDWKTGTHELKAGTNLYIYFNIYYKLNGVSCNGEPVALQGTYLSMKVGVEAMTIDVDVEEYSQIPFTLNVDDPERVGVWPGTSDYSTAFELVAGTNDLSVSENTPSIYVRPTEGNYIVSLTDGEGNDITLVNNTIDITEGMVINIISAELVNDSRFALYTDCPPSSYCRIKMPDGTSQPLNTESAYYAGDNYWVYPFCAAAKQEFVVTLDADPEYDGLFKLYYFVDDEVVIDGTNTWMSGSSIIPANGQVAYGFAAAETPVRKAVTFTADETAAESVQVFQDIINEVPDWQSGVQAFPGTLVSVKGGKDVNVTVDDTPVERTEEGLFKITVSADKDNHVVITRDSSSIVDIEAEGAAAAYVYNLQGIRVASSLENLPAGIYIQGGKKVIKK